MVIGHAILKSKMDAIITGKNNTVMAKYLSTLTHISRETRFALNVTVSQSRSEILRIFSQFCCCCENETHYLFVSVYVAIEGLSNIRHLLNNV